RDVGVVQPLQRRNIPGRVLEEVEPPPLVWTVVGTVTSTDAGVVRHFIDASGAGGRCLNGTNVFGRPGLAVLAEHGLKVRVGFCGGAFKIRIDTYPVHFAPSRHFVLADGRHVVFGLARHDGGVASDTPAQIDRHAPRVFDVFVRR